jgi:hypothetical protein
MTGVDREAYKNPMEDSIIVKELAGSRIVAECATAQSEDCLIALGFANNRDFYIKQVNNEKKNKNH